MLSIIISERDASSIRFSRQTDFEIVFVFLTHLRLHDVNVDIIKNYAFLVTYYLKIHLMLALSHYVVILVVYYFIYVFLILSL